MIYIEAPQRFDRYTHQPVIFLAGGITGCPDWQADTVRRLEAEDVVLVNPRRRDFEGVDPAEQIRWEYDHLRLARAVFFWFPKETLCPITLFEYGKMLVGDKTIFVGTHPDYARRFDIVIQTSLIRPILKVQDSLTAVIQEVIEWEGGMK